MGRAIQVVVDTNAFLWWSRRQFGSLTTPALKALRAADEVGVPVMVCWEIAMLADRGRLQAPTDLLTWLEDVLAAPRFRVLPVTVRTAVDANSLTALGTRDPVDRIIVATAREVGWPLVTSDRRMRRFSGVETIW